MNLYMRYGKMGAVLSAFLLLGVMSFAPICRETENVQVVNATENTQMINAALAGTEASIAAVLLTALNVAIPASLSAVPGIGTALGVIVDAIVDVLSAGGYVDMVAIQGLVTLVGVEVATQMLATLIDGAISLIIGGLIAPPLGIIVTFIITEFFSFFLTSIGAILATA